MRYLPVVSALPALLLGIALSAAAPRDAECPHSVTDKEFRALGGKTKFREELPFEPFQPPSTDYLHIYEGQVVFSVTILTTGRLRDVRAVRASDPRWIDIMLPRVRAFVYEPPKLNGRNVCITDVEITIDIVPEESK